MVTTKAQRTSSIIPWASAKYPSSRPSLHLATQTSSRCQDPRKRSTHRARRKERLFTAINRSHLWMRWWLTHPVTTTLPMDDSMASLSVSKPSWCRSSSSAILSRSLLSKKQMKTRLSRFKVAQCSNEVRTSTPICTSSSVSLWLICKRRATGTRVSQLMTRMLWAHKHAARRSPRLTKISWKETCPAVCLLSKIKTTAVKMESMHLWRTTLCEIRLLNIRI